MLVHKRIQPSGTFPSLLLLKEPEPTAQVVSVMRKEVILTVLQTLREEDGGWWHVRWYNKEGWLQGLDPLTKRPWSCLREIKSYRLYEAWRGNNMFWCGGRIMLGANSTLFVFTNIVILAPALVFLILVGPYLSTWAASIAIETVALILLALSMFYLWRTALLDPGILPAQPSYVKAEPPPSAAADVGIYG